jgi:hypothetical protein
LRTGTKLGAFALGVAAIFVAALFMGRAAGPIDVGSAAGGEHAAMGTASDDVRGLAVADGGLRLELDNDVVPANVPSPFEFRVVDGSGAPVIDFEELHERKLHLIVLSRNLVDYWHLHPTMDSHGSWTAELPAMAPGSYRVFADFQPADGEPLTLSSDIVVPGSVELSEIPPSNQTDDVGPYQGTMAGRALVGPSLLSFGIAEDGEAIRTEPYLGAAGHLVAIRAGDLAFLHVHPQPRQEGATDITFVAEFPSAGTYRLFVDFAHDGDVYTAAFTVEIPSSADPGGH